MKKLILIIIFIPFVSFTQTNSQGNDLPFSEIGDYPNEFSQSNIVSRMIEGLWSTSNLLQIHFYD